MKMCYHCEKVLRVIFYWKAPKIQNPFSIHTGGKGVC